MKNCLLAGRGRTAAVLVAATAIFSNNAHADANAAASNLFNNMALVGVSFGNTKLSDVFPKDTGVRGIYAIMNRQNLLITLTNEAGNLIGDQDGYQVLIPNSTPRKLMPDELANLRSEVMANIDYSKFIKVVYGDGGNRSLLMFSAVANNSPSTIATPAVCAIRRADTEDGTWRRAALSLARVCRAVRCQRLCKGEHGMRICSGTPQPARACSGAAGSAPSSTIGTYRPRLCKNAIALNFCKNSALARRSGRQRADFALWYPFFS
jgi:hypothetical protein